MTRSTAVAAGGVVALLACVARFAFLNADPSVATWVGYVVDEGRWNETARSLALFGTMSDISSNARLHFLLSPGYQLTNFMVFKSMGVDFWSARLLSATAGSLAVLVAYFGLRGRVAPFALMVGVLVLGFEPNLIIESRMAIPELPSAFAMMAAFLALVLPRRTYASAFVAGMLAAAAVALKATTVLVLPVLPAIILLSTEEGAWRQRLLRVAALIAGFGLLVAVGLAGALALGMLDKDGILYAGSRLLDFLVLASPYVGVIRFFDAADLEARNLVLLGIWFCSWAYVFRSPRASATAVDLYRTSGVWAAGWLLAWSASLYLPGRYVVHLVIPAALHVMAGLSLLDADTSKRIAEDIRRRSLAARVAAVAWLVLPAAILLATLVSGLYSLAMPEAPRLGVRLGIIAASTALLVLVLARSALTPSTATALLIVPVLGACSWLVLREIGVVRQLWKFDHAAALLGWTVACAVVVAASVALARRGSLVTPQVGAAALGFVALALVGQTLPALTSPTYSIRDASLDLGRRLHSTRDVREFSAESLFLANRLPFRALDHRQSSVGAVVMFEHGAQSTNVLKSNRLAGLTRSLGYALAANRRYDLEGGRFGPLSVGLYFPEPTR